LTTKRQGLPYQVPQLDAKSAILAQIPYKPFPPMFSGESTTVTAEEAKCINAHCEEMAVEINRLRKALAFAASVIKSGESWSRQCEENIGQELEAV
jgi:hypothetical protein